jgi:hypothetical protein
MPSDAERFRILGFLQCSACGSVVGAMDLINIGGMLQQLRKDLNLR